MDIIYSNEDKFEYDINDKKVLAVFYADWCKTCKMIGGELDKIKDDIKIVKVNVDSNHSLTKQYGIMSIPTLLFFKKDGSYEKHIGFMKSEEILNAMK